MSIRLIIDGTEIALNKGAYKEYPRVVETRNKTEAGTTHRDITRVGIGHLDISMTADETEKAFFDSCANASALSVRYWSETANALVHKDMFLDPESYSADLITETVGHRLYSIAFSLEEF